MMKHKKRGQLPAVLRTEMRRTIALNSFSRVYPKNVKLAHQHQCIEDQFHGNPARDITPQKDMLCRGEGVYAEMFVLTENNANVRSLKLKSLYSRSIVPYISGKEITSEVLERKFFKGKEPMKGRALYDLAQQSLRTIRRACAKVKRLLNEDGTIKEKGKTVYDVATCILDEMYEELKGRNQIYDVDVDADDDESKKDGEESHKDNHDGTEDNSDESHVNVDNSDTGTKESDLKTTPDFACSDFSARRRPDEWMFAGYMAFMLFGPMAPPERRIDFFKLKDPNRIEKREIGPSDYEKKEFARVACQAAQTAQQMDDRKEKCSELSFTTGNNNDNNGDIILNSDTIAAVNEGIALNKRVNGTTLDIRAATRPRTEVDEGNFSALKLEADLLERQISRACRLAERTGRDEDWDRYNKLELEMDVIRKTMKELRQSKYPQQQPANGSLKRKNETIDSINSARVTGEGVEDGITLARKKQSTEIITVGNGNAGSENNGVSIIVRIH